MSVTVAVEDLPAAIADRRLAYLVTVGEGVAKVVAVDVVADGERLVLAGVGPGSRRHVAEQPAVTLVFPPVDVHEMTLLVDGTATVPTDDDVVVVARRAVLHRPAPSLRR